MLSESEQCRECATSNSSDPTLSGAVDSKEKVVRGPISGAEMPTKERAGSATNDQHPECTPSTLTHQGPEKAVEFKEPAVANTTNQTNGDQKDLSCVVPDTPSPPLEEPTVNQDLNGGNATTDTVVMDAETVRVLAVLEGSEFPNSPEVGSTHSGGQETTPPELSERKGDTSESASTEPQQKAPETEAHLGSSPKIKDSKTDAQVSNIACISKKLPSCNFCLFRFSRVKRVASYK